MADPRGGGTAADEVLGCSQDQDLQFEKLLHLQSTPTTSPRNAVSQGVRRWHLPHTEPTAATLGEQKVMAQSPPGCSPTLCPEDLPTC